MSTHPKTSAAPENREPDKPKLDLSLPQVIGGALAAMTAAFLGSRLSVAGTVVGAALASIVAAVAGNLYTASLHTTQEKVKTVFQGKVAGSAMPATVTEVGSAEPVPASSAPAAGTVRSVRRLPLRRILPAALAAFALAAAVLTGLELATGQALSGGHGTTITQVTESRGTAPRPRPSPAATTDSSESPSSSPSASASHSPEPTPSEQPSTTPAPRTSAPSASPSPGAGDARSPAPTSTPTATPTGTPKSPDVGGASAASRQGLPGQAASRQGPSSAGG